MKISSCIASLYNRIYRVDSGISRKLASLLFDIYNVTGNLKCPICDSTVRRFRSYGSTPRPNALCPKCGSLERQRLLWLYLNDKTDFFSADLMVLHFAPESCFVHFVEKAPNLHYISADIESPAMLRTDIALLPFKDGIFDVILCSHVLEHVHNDAKALEELFRVLKPGGWAITQVPIVKTCSTTFEDSSVILPEDRLAYFGQSDHLRVYGRYFADRLERTGFSVKVYDYVTEFPPQLIDRYGLDRSEDVYLVKKPV